VRVLPFFWLDFGMIFFPEMTFCRIFYELRFRNPKLQLVVLVTIVALLRVYIFITNTLV
jgi:hypothetical protein